MSALPASIHITSPVSLPQDADADWRSVLKAADAEDGATSVSAGMLHAIHDGTATVWTAVSATPPAEASAHGTGSARNGGNVPGSPGTDGPVSHPVAAAEGAHGQTVAVAALSRQGERLAAEIVVHPAFRLRGIGRELVRTLLGHHQSVTAEVTHDDPWLWSHGDHPGARRLAHEFGLKRGRELLQMRHTVSGTGSGGDGGPAPFGEPSLAEGVVIRTFRRGEDEEEWLRVNNAAFSWHPEQGHQTLEAFRHDTGAEDFDPEGFFLAVPADDPATVLGFHQTKIHSDTGLGEVYVLGVDPQAHSRGLGRALTLAGLNYLASAGVPAIQLYVEGDNDKALGLYRSLGFAVHATDVSYTRSRA